MQGSDYRIDHVEVAWVRGNRRKLFNAWTRDGRLVGRCSAPPNVPDFNLWRYVHRAPVAAVNPKRLARDQVARVMSIRLKPAHQVKLRTIGMAALRAWLDSLP
jgi:hypothetical protein